MAVKSSIAGDKSSIASEHMFCLSVSQWGPALTSAGFAPICLGVVNFCVAQGLWIVLETHVLTLIQLAPGEIQVRQQQQTPLQGQTHLIPSKTLNGDNYIGWVGGGDLNTFPQDSQHRISKEGGIPRNA